MGNQDKGVRLTVSTREGSKGLSAVVRKHLERCWNKDVERARERRGLEGEGSTSDVFQKQKCGRYHS